VTSGRERRQPLRLVSGQGAVAGLLYTVASPAVAFGYLAAWMLIAAVVLVAAGRLPRTSASASPRT